MIDEQPPVEPPKPCRACGRAIPQDAQTCSHCGGAQAPRDDYAEGGLRALGDGPTPPSGPRTPPPPSRLPAPPPPAGPRPTGGNAEPAGARLRRGEGGLWEFVQEQWKTDRWFAVLLGLIALQAVLALVSGNLLGLIVSGVVLWGLLTYNYWVYVIMVVIVGLSVVSGGLMFITGQLSLGSLPGLGVSTFIFVVLLQRHEQYM